MSKRRSPCYQENLTLSRCKRIIRPLISKIHSLNDLHAKYPSLLEFQFPYEDYSRSKRQNKERGKPNLYTSSSRPSSRDSTGSKNARLQRKSRKDVSGVNDGDMCYSDDEFTFVLESSSPMKTAMVDNETNWGHIPRLIKPETSFERLQSLQPFITYELYQNYVEVFQIFKNIVTTTIMNRNESNTSGVPKLASLCAFKIGKSIALSTKSTYYKLNQTMLFDSETIPDHLQRYHEDLFDDIDQWLEMEPEVVSLFHRTDLLIGYVIHLIVFNSNRLFYLLVPVLVHWLYEESIQAKCSKLRSVMRTLFVEYWGYGNQYFESIDTDIIANLNGHFNKDGNFETFWIFYKIGYWETLINSLELKSNPNVYNDFDCLILDTLPINNKLNLRGLSEIDVEFANHNFLNNDIYKLIRINPEHSQVNNILIHIITQIIIMTRSDLKLCATSIEILDCLNHSYDDVMHFIHTWLSFSSDGKVVFNSLYPGNDIIFQATLKICNFILSKCGRVISQLSNFISNFDDYDLNITDKSIFTCSEREFNHLFKKINILHRTIMVFRAFFLDISEHISIIPHSPEEISNLIIKLQKNKPIYIRKSNPGFNEILIWLYDKQDESLLTLAKLCFQKYYGYNEWFKERRIDDVRYLLFEGDEFSDYEETDTSRLTISDDDCNDINDNDRRVGNKFAIKTNNNKYIRIK